MSQINWTVTISPEGEISSDVNGLKGEGCKALTKDFEREAGTVVSDSTTKEYREKAVTSNKASV